jgi:hypothetical protein
MNMSEELAQSTLVTKGWSGDGDRWHARHSAANADASCLALNARAVFLRSAPQRIPCRTHMRRKM